MENVQEKLLELIKKYKNTSTFGYLHGMILSLGIKDPYTEGHSYRVAYYSLAIAYKFGYSNLELLYLGALVHDIGKVGIPDTVLLKPSSFSVQERKIMDYHPLLGKLLLEAIESEEGKFFRNCASLHHERINGKGYPYGLKDDEIPIEANIIAIADIFDALITERPYKKAKPIEEAMDLIIKGKGKAFFPELVEAAEDILPKVYKNPYYHIVSIPKELENFKKESFFKDELTGLYKFSYIKEQIEENIHKLQNHFAIFLDIKELVFINLKRGWNEGDKIIENIANSLRKIFVYFSRMYGGKFFGILEKNKLYEFTKSINRLEKFLNISITFIYEPILVQKDENINIDFFVANLEKKLEKLKYLSTGKTNSGFYSKNNNRNNLRRKSVKQGLRAFIK